MKVASFQASLPAVGTADMLQSIRARIQQCEAEGVAILCCPEAVLGGLADCVEHPARIAIRSDTDQLASTLAPLASETVSTIIGFTEATGDGRLFNTAAVYHRGKVVGLYRKLHPAINRSVYRAGTQVPVFQVGALKFGIVICNDSNFPQPAKLAVAQGASVLFVPTNNSLPLERDGAEVVADARACDVCRARENGCWVIRADVAGRTDALMSIGSSAITRFDGAVVCTARPLSDDLLILKLDSSSGIEPRAQREGSRYCPPAEIRRAYCD